MPPAWTWEELLAEYRALGGIADNVDRREGPLGMGLFPIDPSRPATLHTPASLLVPCRHVRQSGDELIVSPESGLDPRAVDFFSRYQRAFSWGSEARADVERFHRMLAELPDDIARALVTVGIDIKHPLGKEWAPFELFKTTRVITYRGEPVFMPMIDMINHGRDAQGYDTSEGIRVAGTFPGEILVNYGPADSLGRFFSQQFISDEPTAFSLTITIPTGIGGQTLLIGRRIGEKQPVGGIPLLPTLRQEGDRLLISHLMLGNERMPRLPRTLFRKLMHNLTTDHADDLFQRIVSTNMLLLIGLLEALDAHDSEIARQLRKMARLQLKGIAQSYGALPPGTTISPNKKTPQ